MKRVLALLLTLMMVMSLVACGTAKKEEAAPEETAEEATEEEAAEEEATEEATEPTGDVKRVCFVARASADTFAAWLTNEIKKEAYMRIRRS